MTELATAPVVTASPGDAGRGSLARAELRRFRSRRFIQVLLVLAALGYALAIGFAAATAFGKTTPAQLAAAERNIAQIVEEQNRYREQCLNDANRPPGTEGLPAEQFCGPPNTAENFPAEQFLDKQPFILAAALPAGGLAVAAATAALAFVLGATYVGAEWSSRSMVALLFWEPRRLKVMRVKLGVLVGACVLLGVVSQALWWGTAIVMARTLGRTGPLPDGFYADLLAQQGRSVLLAVLTGLLGFAIANLVRNTGAALGVGFVYFAVVETAVRNIRGSWQEWLLTDNAVALILEGGNRLFLYDEGFVDERGNFVNSGRELLLTNLHGAVVLGGVTMALVALGVVLFQRRDLH
ncbi:MAG: ABC transporter permease subunit [Mycobacteriales bacterium]